MIQTTFAHLGIAATAAALCLAACSSAPAKPGGGDETVASLADRYFEEVAFKYVPTRATRAGFHQYDTRLEDFSRGTIEAELAALKDYERRIQALAVPADVNEAADRELLLSEVRSGILSAAGKGTPTSIPAASPKARSSS